MTTSGTRTFNPEFAEMLSEAFARILVRPLAVTQEHIDEAVRSANLMLIEFSNSSKGVRQYQLQQVTQTLTQSAQSFTLPAGSLDIFSMVLRRDGMDTPVWPMSRTDYLYIPDKANEGRPFNFYMDKSALVGGLRSVFLWPAPENSTDQLIMWVLKQAEDVTTGLLQTGPVSTEWSDAYAAGLAKRLAAKFAPQLVADLRAEAKAAFDLAAGAERERGPLRLKMRGYTRGARF